MQLKEYFEKHNQGHVFKYWNELSDTEKSALEAQLKQIDLDELDELVNTLVKGDNKAGQAAADFSSLKPAPYIALPKDKDADEQWKNAKLVGEEAIRKGRLACFTVAGGQGTRLGFDAPKGLYPITPVKGKSLFQVFAEKILFANKKYGVRIPWLIMTSQINNAATVKFFEDNSYFGLDKEDVIFFSQGLMPAVDLDGKIIMEGKGRIVMTPDGHGGCLRGMCRSGALAKIRARGADCISYWQVDNPLVNLIDPYFLGFHILGKSDMSSKMIPKAYALEKVGHFCLDGDKVCVIEYSDLPAEYQELTDENGKLKFIAGSVAIHILSADFVESAGGDKGALKLPFHRANKKIPFIDANANLIKPDKPNGVKFEMFVFDALPMSKNPVIIEGARGDEFSPVKNAEGVDSPATCKADQKKQWARWFKAAGVEIPVDDKGVPLANIEVSPLFATNQDDFVKAWNALEPKPEIKDGLYIS